MASLSSAAGAAASRLVLPSASARSNTKLPPFTSASTSSPLNSLRSAPLVSRLFLQQRSSSAYLMRREFSSAATPKCFASDPEQLKSAREDIRQLLKTTYSHPIMGFSLCVNN